jgi:hypothetical protein
MEKRKEEAVKRYTNPKREKESQEKVCEVTFLMIMGGRNYTFFRWEDMIFEHNIDPYSRYSRSFSRAQDSFKKKWSRTIITITNNNITALYGGRCILWKNYLNQ